MTCRIIQWNARSLIANGQEFKKVVHEMTDLPDLICIQETWLKSHLDFVIPGYVSIRKDRLRATGGGCATFIKNGVAYREVTVETQYEYIKVEVWTSLGKITIINYYNPCEQISLMELNNIWSKEEGIVIWCGDFNAHSVVWGSPKSDKNGTVVEEYMEDNLLVCLNDGSGTRFDVRKQIKSCVDLTVVSASIAVKCHWEVLEQSSVGSDHFPIFCKVGLEMQRSMMIKQHRWKFEKADWEKYNKICELELMSYSTEDNIDKCTEKLSLILVKAAEESIPKVEGNRRKTAVE